MNERTIGRSARRPADGHRAAKALAGLSLTLALASLAELAAAAPGAPLGKQIAIGYLQVSDDSRYDDRQGPGETVVTPGRPIDGANMGIDEVNIDASISGRRYALVEEDADSDEELAARADALQQRGVHWILVDADDGAMAKLARAERGKPVLLFNVSAPGDALRGADCQADLVNVIPSRAMLADALAQFLLARKWPQVLVLRGPQPADQADAAAFAHAAKLYGLKIVATRDFIVSNDPRQRNADNLALLTGDSSYDVVYVADNDGTFARSVPYATVHPRPVIGATGLVPTAWSWTWERYGAPQVSHRFAGRFGRQMDGTAWAAWIAVRAIDDAIRESKGARITQAVDAYLLGPTMNIDGAKGPPMSFRSWDHQLRQPILLTTANAVIADAPMPGFLHQTNVLDTLGFDRPETQCRLH
jgi:ABC transporter substrate binding protein (PQQ-dependent alcohol dehydrogenase system)